ncbi:MAG: relaxase/mobilization nuclease domain-containing protein [Oscillospiraceae bacterium]|nr:relaxase/mobilization nuclease domain-containing protein [Oscillospiraceae bacterium]
MAITKIFKITTTVYRSIKYAENDKYEVKEINDNREDDISRSISYAERDKIISNDKFSLNVYKTFNSYNICTSGNANKIFEKCKEDGLRRNKSKQKLTKDGEMIIAYHLFQSFETNEKMPAHVANEIGSKLVKEVFPNYPCVISTHTNTDNIHNHIIICAWDVNGRKWNDDLNSKRLIRRASDKLCEEYGLNVLYETQDMKVCKYKDKNGITRFFEPTDRKINLAKERQLDEIIGDVNDYRNTKSYADYVETKLKREDIIKNDIDKILPIVISYDDLLDRLKDIGYKINDKKKNGEWLKHITFTAPSHEKGVRDNKIGDGIFYLRENLTSYIDKLYQDRNINKQEFDDESLRKKSIEIEKEKIDKEDNLRLEDIKNLEKDYIEEYRYENLDVSKIDEEKRVAKDTDGSFYYEPRSSIEKIILLDIKKTDIEVRGLIDTSGLKRIIEEQNRAKKERKKGSLSKREEELIRQIRESFESLRTAENYKIRDYEHVNSIYRATYEKYMDSLNQLNQADQIISHFKTVLEVPKQAFELQEKVNASKNNIDYMFESYTDDVYTLEKMKNTMSQYKIEDEDGREKLKNKILDAEKRVAELKSRLFSYDDEIQELKQCIRVLDRISEESGNHIPINSNNEMKSEDQRDSTMISNRKRDSRNKA